MTWYGSKLDTKVKAPRLTPAYHTEDLIVSLVEATKKKTHKKLTLRDTLLIELATTSGMRRSELAGDPGSCLSFLDYGDDLFFGVLSWLS